MSSFGVSVVAPTWNRQSPLNEPSRYIPLSYVSQHPLPSAIMVPII